MAYDQLSFHDHLRSPICSLFFQMLSEVGFQAGQHEVLSEAFCKERYKGVMGEVKALKEARKKNMKEAEKIAAELGITESGIT